MCGSSGPRTGGGVIAIAIAIVVVVVVVVVVLVLRSVKMEQERSSEIELRRRLRWSFLQWRQRGSSIRNEVIGQFMEIDEAERKTASLFGGVPINVDNQEEQSWGGADKVSDGEGVLGSEETKAPLTTAILRLNRGRGS
ncbi:uncharacterized protein ColSpa_10112 [Colletotrichum spaethianum]|uniref:Uncharacterized protein n=1 Tax=Colletotrichum spaethianum TaxID=700344 RepID=A0AA37PCY3_9PEZI|nr:uncharacterized protein ColSpa_10112 [Colletotrichum spaethianum]GKT49931.1 hypothetical protein ColSpa_10112 [Colletotrichum spaethianum]